jgi:CBS-domain-containing membrane protein
MTRVRDVMTAQVVAVDRLTPYREVARLLASHRINGLPVVMADRRVVGVVSETDLLALYGLRGGKVRPGKVPVAAAATRAE